MRKCQILTSIYTKILLHRKTTLLKCVSRKFGSVSIFRLKLLDLYSVSTFRMFICLRGQALKHQTTVPDVMGLILGSGKDFDVFIFFVLLLLFLFLGTNRFFLRKYSHSFCNSNPVKLQTCIQLYLNFRI